MSTLLRFFLFSPLLPSPFVVAMSVTSFVSLSFCGLSEVRGKHLRYSKFRNTVDRRQQINDGRRKRNGREQEKTSLSSRVGMLILYAPACLSGAAALLSTSFVPFSSRPLFSLRFWLLSWALTLHFLKRILEVLFIHKYSGGMALESTIVISLSYFSATATALYAQFLTEGAPEPPLDLKFVGVALFILGICGNFYHHLLLSKLRQRDDDKGYKIPKGGLFSLVICPHYLFEIIGFVGFSLISQTLYASSFMLGSFAYLMGRSYATRRWYQEKFPNFPAGIKALIPYIF